MTRLFGCLWVCCLLLSLSAFGVYAAEYDVSWDGTGDFTTIQDAIDAAVDGDVIVVDPGTYYENIHFVGENITLRSLDPEDEEIVASTVIDGAQKDSVVTFNIFENETCLLYGFTIINGKSTDTGGGILGQDTLAAISNCTITGNWASDGGGGLDRCNGTISNCTISDNYSAYYYGGGLRECDATISNCRISGNSANGGGGLGWCDATISNCTISGNSAAFGGGLYNCQGTITNCTISGISATGEYGTGSGLSECSGTISNCTISDNYSAYYYAGGLRECDATITNCIVWGNAAPTGSLELIECRDAVITYSCIRGWIAGGEGNISDDPLFVTGPLGAYYLSCMAAEQAADSPCIDRGSGTAESLGLDNFTTRTDHVPDSRIVDMGYHYPLTPGQNPYTGCSLNSSEFAPGELLLGFIEAHNPGPDVAVDAYVAFVLPDGAIVSLTSGGLAIGTHPWVSNVVLPSGFDFAPTEVLRTTVPQSPGDYLFAAVLTKPGQFDFIAEPSLFPFAIRE